MLRLSQWGKARTKKFLTSNAMADNMSIDKKEPTREGSEDSMELNSPTPEAETGAPPENAAAAQQKRKGGRKPVCCCSTLPLLV